MPDVPPFPRVKCRCFGTGCSGSGSGKSLADLVPIVDEILRQHADGTYRPGVKAIIVNSSTVVSP